eukprot:763620-Hanusia_phi.AAC.2
MHLNGLFSLRVAARSLSPKFRGGPIPESSAPILRIRIFFWHCAAFFALEIPPRAGSWVESLLYYYDQSPSAASTHKAAGFLLLKATI